MFGTLSFCKQRAGSATPSFREHHWPPSTVWGTRHDHHQGAVDGEGVGAPPNSVGNRLLGDAKFPFESSMAVGSSATATDLEEALGVSVGLATVESLRPEIRNEVVAESSPL